MLPKSAVPVVLLVLSQMGGLLSYVWAASPVVNDGSLDIPDPQTGLTKRQKHFVEDTWAMVKKDIAGNGIELFMRFFAALPEAQKRFKGFANLSPDELRKSKRLLAHTNSVMYALDGIIANLEDPELMSEMLMKLGENHGRRHIPEKEFFVLKEVLMKLLKDKLDIHLTPEGEEAWGKTIDVMYKFIFKGMQENQ